jgi:hypothetical protein
VGRGRGTGISHRHSQVRILPQRTHHRHADPSTRLGAADRDVADGNSVRHGRFGRRAYLLRVLEARTNGSALDLKRIGDWGEAAQVPDTIAAPSQVMIFIQKMLSADT